jgi:RluA family pseudouridine synthase
MIFTSRIHPPVKPGTTLAEYLSARFTYHTHDEWVSAIGEGQVTLNNARIDPGAVASAGDTISYDPGEFEEPSADLNYRIIYEDEWLLGVDKPGNLLVHRAGKSVTHNLMYQLRSVHVPPWPAAHSVHRLDRETSGVILVAKGAEIVAAMTRERAFSTAFTKIYYAIARGRPPVGEISLPLGKPEHSAIPYKFGIIPGGKPAMTRIIDSQPLGLRHSLLTLQPVTGRTHQIRVHLEAIGAPVVGDKLYGRSEEEYLQWRVNPLSIGNRLEFPRHALHCASMTFMHPFLKKECRIEAPMPEDMKGLIASLSA